MSKATFSGSAMVLLVSDIEKSIDFYKRLGFNEEFIGGPDVQCTYDKR